MKKRFERGLDGRIRIRKDGSRDGRVNSRVLAAGLVIAFVALAATGIGVAIAEGDMNQFTHGEDDGYYDDNNNNIYPDEEFPGDSIQNRTGI